MPYKEKHYFGDGFVEEIIMTPDEVEQAAENELDDFIMSLSSDEDYKSSNPLDIIDVAIGHLQQCEYLEMSNSKLAEIFEEEFPMGEQFSWYSTIKGWKAIMQTCKLLHNEIGNLEEKILKLQKQLNEI